MENKNCENCKYFVAYYIYSGTHFSKAGGICTYKKQKRNNFINMYKSAEHCCVNWESGEEKREAKRRGILLFLEDMEKHLADIKYYLQCEE